VNLSEAQFLNVVLDVAMPHLFQNDLLLAPTPKPDRFELGVYPRFGRSDHAHPLYAVDVSGWNTAYELPHDAEKLADAITGLLDNLLAGALSPRREEDNRGQDPADAPDPR
jgi:hypothetical protein